jgi:GH35 family endo-1,4-beta-xylanase
MNMKKMVTCIFLSAFLLPAFGYAGTALTIQAEKAQINTVGAFADLAWNLWSNGEWGDFLSFAKPGTYRVRVLCYGSPANGVWPEMAFCVNGRTCETVTVATNKATEHTFEFDAETKDYRITVSFLNDAMTKTEDRNLYVVSLSIQPLGNAPTPIRTTEQAWRARWGKEEMQRERDILAKAAKTIEQDRKIDATVRVVNEQGRLVAGVRLAVKLIRHDFLFGGNIFMFDRFGTSQQNELYKRRFRELFNYATTGFYWRSYERERGKPAYAYTDKVVTWCAQNHISLKGHPLLWACESGTPPWSKGQPQADVRKKRVTNIMTRYAGKIDFWEVVNEPSHLPGLTIDEPYRWAREVNPNAALIVNDYDAMANGCPPFFALLQNALGRGVPFDGIGIQAHEPRTMRFPLDQVWNVLDQYAAVGKPLHITEFTPTSGGQEITGSHITGRWDEAAQAEYAVKFYTVCFAHPAVMAITWWDLCDVGSWLEGGGLLRKDLSPKPAYAALKQLIHEQWVTRSEGQTDKDGNFSFRGFRGQYMARITRGGKVIEQPFHVGTQNNNVINIVLREKPSNTNH